MAFDFALAWLDAAPPDPRSRVRLEAGLMRTARHMVERHADWGRQALAALVPQVRRLSHARGQSVGAAVAHRLAGAID